MKFERLFTITCVHQYFEGGPCNDLQIEPTDACKKLLKRYRMTYIQEGAGTISITRQQPETKEEFKMPACTSVLAFYLFVSDTSFYTYTKNTPQSKDNMWLFSNKHTATNKPALDVTEDKKLPAFTVQNRNLFGKINITPPGTFFNYTLNLEAAATKWRYYIVASGNKNLRVNGTSPDTAFVPVTDADRLQADTIYQALRQSGPGTNLFLYESATTLAFLQSPRKKIQLLDTVNATVIIDNLPNPSATENGCKIINI